MVLLLIVLLLLLAFLSLFLGRYTVSPWDVVEILAQKITGRSENTVNTTVIWDIRMPRILLAMLAGAGLSVSGAAFQGCFHNPLVSPDMLGVSAGAGFGAAFGPLVLFSLFWRRTTWQGALAGMVSGGVTAIVWQNLQGGIFDVYELVPGFLIASLLIIVISLCTKPNQEVMEEFDRVKTAKIGE